MVSDNIFTVSPWLDQLDYDWTDIEKAGKTKHYKKNDMLYHFGDPVQAIYIVKTGRVRLFLTSIDGREKAIAIIGKNGLLGESNLYNPSSHISNAITASPTTVIAIQKDTFRKAIGNHRHYANQIIDMISWKVHLLSMHSLQLSFGTSMQRLCDTFIHLGLTYGQKDRHDNVKISISFTHQELADLIGTTRVTVSNHIKRLITENLISKPRKFYIIHNMKKLSEMLLE